MPDPGTLVDLGGWATAVALAIGVVTAIIRGQLVPGHVYRREVKRGDRLEQANERLVQRVGVLELAPGKGSRRG